MTAQAPSPLEKVLVLRDAKLLRFVPERFLPLLADVAEVEVLGPGRLVASRGARTDAALRVLADGGVELRVDAASPPVVLAEPSASFGNTGLLADHTWPYAANAGSDLLGNQNFERVSHGWPAGCLAAPRCSRGVDVVRGLPRRSR